MFWGAGLEPKNIKYLFDSDGIGKTGMNENYREQEGLLGMKSVLVGVKYSCATTHVLAAEAGYPVTTLAQLGSVPLLL